MGKSPFISSYAMFSPGLNWEQIRTTICYNNVNVKIGGSYAGVSVGPDGGSHQALEDIAITRVFPRMIAISPCDAIEAKNATLAAARVIWPTFIRLARARTPVITTEEAPFEIGKATMLYEGKDKADVGIVATGALVHQALLAARQLEADRISVKVLNLSTIKPWIMTRSFLSLEKRGRLLPWKNTKRPEEWVLRLRNAWRKLIPFDGLHRRGRPIQAIRKAGRADRLLRNENRVPHRGSQEDASEKIAGLCLIHLRLALSMPKAVSAHAAQATKSVPRATGSKKAISADCA